MYHWGWRIPFLFGGLLAIVSYVIRRTLMETPEFEQDEEKDQYIASFDPLMKVLRMHFQKVLLAMGLIFFECCFDYY